MSKYIGFIRSYVRFSFLKIVNIRKILQIKIVRLDFGVCVCMYIYIYVRPKLTWAEEIRGLMEEKGLMEEAWNDRDNWRKNIIYLSNGRRKM